MGAGRGYTVLHFASPALLPSRILLCLKVTSVMVVDGGGHVVASDDGLEACSRPAEVRSLVSDVSEVVL